MTNQSIVETPKVEENKPKVEESKPKVEENKPKVEESKPKYKVKTYKHKLDRDTGFTKSSQKTEKDEVLASLYKRSPLYSKSKNIEVDTIKIQVDPVVKTGVKVIECKEDKNKQRPTQESNYTTIEQVRRFEASKVKPEQVTENIDDIRVNRDKVILIRSLETKTHNFPSDCLNCVYRERDIGTCWYLMVTNKGNKINGTTCEHFVDWEKYNKIKKES